MLRALLHTDTAARTFLLIDYRMKIFDRNGACRTIFHTDATADTACHTGFNRINALVLRTT